MPGLPDLTSAISAGIITPETALSLQTHFSAQTKNQADEENFRLVTGFNDIFVVIASLLLLISATYIGSTIRPWLGPLFGVPIAWGLSEVFVGKKRMALPAIVLLIAFVIEAGLTVGIALGWQRYAPQESLSVLAACITAVLAAFVHWRRFQVPITVAIGTASGIGIFYIALLAGVPLARNFIGEISLAAGIATFLLAMFWDAKDTARQTRRSDVAFWLHLLAAPLIVHSTFTYMGGTGALQAWQAAVFIGVYILIGVISLIIDRRAMMVSALAYVLYALSSLLKTYGVVGLGFAVTAFVIGSALLLLSAFWHGARAPLVRSLPNGLRRLVPSVG